MKRALESLGGLVAGATFGGLLVGICEGLYRDAGVLYAALLYGTLWVLIGAPLAIAVALLQRNRPPTAQFRWGLALSLVPSTAVLVRFVVLRDLMHETRSAALVSIGAGLVAAMLVLVVIVKVARALAHRFATEELRGPGLWLLPLLVAVAFAVHTQAGDDPLPQNLPEASALTGRGVILVVIDALRADALGIYGAKPHRGEPPSPKIDALSRRGLTFLDASAQASWTKPAVASILTSRHVSGHDTMSKPAVLPAALPTIASELEAAGVKTAAVVTNYNLEAGYGFDRGFTTFNYLAPARYLGAPERANRLAAYNVYRLLRERLFRGSREARYFYRSGNTVNARALELLDEIGHGDFFLYLHYMEPHDPYFDADGASWAKVSDPNPPATWAPRMLNAYRDEVRRVDGSIGELMEALRARGLDDRVTMVLLADHGEEFAEHGGFYHGTTLYEEQLRIPLIIIGPGVTVGVDTALAREVDVAPTVLGRFGRKAPPTWEGRDLLAGGEPPLMTLAEEDHEGNLLAAVRFEGNKLITANADNPRGLSPNELYNLPADPMEKENLQRDSARVAVLKNALDRARAAARQGGATAQKRVLDDAAEAELRALGYMR
jgi:arylsulfatase A-like enzyme